MGAQHISLLLCLIIFGVFAVGANADGDKKRPNYNHYSYHVEPMADYGEYPEYPEYPDYEDDPHSERSRCNYTQNYFCRTYGFTNLTDMDQAGFCEAKKQRIDQNNYTHECSLMTPNGRPVNYCCCQFFEQQTFVNYTLLMCCKESTSQPGHYACNHLWNTVEQINHYDDSYFGSGSNLTVQILTVSLCLLLTTSWFSEQR